LNHIGHGELLEWGDVVEKELKNGIKILSKTRANYDDSIAERQYGEAVWR
jgi:hypothetical protein